VERGAEIELGARAAELDGRRGRVAGDDHSGAWRLNVASGEGDEASRPLRRDHEEGPGNLHENGYALSDADLDGARDVAALVELHSNERDAVLGGARLAQFEVGIGALPAHGAGLDDRVLEFA